MWILNTSERVLFWIPISIMMFFCILLGGLYSARFHSINNVQHLALTEIPQTDPTTVYYDLHCTTLAMRAMNTFLDPPRRDAGISALIISKKWSNAERAYDLMLEL